MRPWRGAGLAVALTLAACAPAPPPLPSAPVPAGPGVVVRAEPTPLDPTDPARDRVGTFAYAGGLVLTSEQTSRLHGLSDLKVTPDGRLLAVTDDGDLLEARLVLDPSGRLAGLAEARLTGLMGEDGQPLAGKRERDAEGLAVLPGGDRLVSFERHHRILLYPAAGGPPRRAPTPADPLPENDGLEALAALPWVAADAYLVGAEPTGRTWTCRVSGPCVAGPQVDLPAGAGLVAVAPLPDGRIGWLLRSWNPLEGNRVTVLLHDAAGREIDRLFLAPPLNVDNFEGLAIVAGDGESLRLYLISDDNFSASQRTLLLAFDWSPNRQIQRGR